MVSVSTVLAAEYFWGREQAIPLDQQPPVGYITFSLAVNSSRPDSVSDYTAEIALARNQCGDKNIKVVNMAELSLADQAKLAANTVVLVTNHCGGSVGSMFLKRHCAVLVYWGNVIHLDHVFYESVSYYRTTWVSPEEWLFVERTMALIDVEIERTEAYYPDILVGKGDKHG